MDHEGTSTAKSVAQSFIIKRPRADEASGRIRGSHHPAHRARRLREVDARSGVAQDLARSRRMVLDLIRIRRRCRPFDGHRRRVGYRPKATPNARLPLVSLHSRRPNSVPTHLPTPSPRVGPNGERRLVLAIADYHHLSSNAAAEDFVGTLVQLLPVTLVITSRTRPTWHAPRFAVYGEAFELGVNNLTMTDEEAEEVLRRSNQIHAKNSIGLARGWPAIIGLAAHALRQDLPDVIPARLYESSLLESWSSTS